MPEGERPREREEIKPLPPREVARQRHFERMREKVVQHCKDFWRPYHGSTRHVEEDDGNQMIEKKKSGNHMPLNAAVMALWKPGKLKDSRDLFGRELYWLASWKPAIYGELHDLFFSYGAGDSNYDFLQEQALSHGPCSESARKLRAVDEGIDLITKRLVEAGVTDRDFWADFGLNAVPTKRSATAGEKDRERYLIFLEECERIKGEGKTRYKTAALRATAERRGEARSTIQAAVEKAESGYLKDEAS